MGWDVLKSHVRIHGFPVGRETWLKMNDKRKLQKAGNQRHWNQERYTFAKVFVIQDYSKSLRINSKGHFNSCF